jgi:hypothetical protein
MLNDSIRVMRRSRRAWPTAARSGAVIIAAAVLATACSGSPSSIDSGGSSNAGASANAGGAANSPSSVGYSSCIRSNGVPDFPDPGPGGALPKSSAQRLGVSDSQLQAAQQDCQNLLPTTGSFQQLSQQCFATGDCPPALVQQMLTAEQRFAQCMRSHGVPDWPDPTLDSEGRPGFDISVSQDGFNPDTQFTTEQSECERLTGSPVPRAVSA